jgi:hypothetical protein
MIHFGRGKSRVGKNIFKQHFAKYFLNINLNNFYKFEKAECLQVLAILREKDISV